MNYLFKMSDANLASFGKNWGWFLVWGVALVILGLVAIGATTMTTMISIVLIGILLLVGGVVIIIDTFTFWWGHWRGFFLHLLMGILYLIVGILFVKNPVYASISLTWLLAILFIGVGIFRSAYALSLKAPQWGWTLFNGLITLLLGLMILANWPASSLFVIGLFVGIDLLFCGWAYIMAALSARALTH